MKSLNYDKRLHSLNNKMNKILKNINKNNNKN